MQAEGGGRKMRQRRRQNFLKGFSGRQLSKKDGGPGSKRRGTLAEHPAKVGALYGWIPVAVEIGGNTD